jgi:alpha-tubulin suppressor-like RCC1 family protein
VAAGGNQSLAIRTNGTLWAWGLNNIGQLGDGTTVSRTSPVSVIGGFTNWCQVSVGYDHAVAVRTNGTAWAWGFNNYGRLGDGTATFKSSPVSVIGGFTDWSQISAGGFHTIGLRSNPNFT